MGHDRTVTLTPAECCAIHALIDDLSGGNAGNAFAWDGTDDPNDVGTGALIKVYRAAGADVPGDDDGCDSVEEA